MDRLGVRGGALLFLFAWGGTLAGQTVVGEADWNWADGGGKAALVSLGRAEVPLGGKRGVRITVLRPSVPFYETMLTATIKPPLRPDTLLRFRFWARSSTGNQVRAILEKSTAPYTTLEERVLTLGSGWKAYEFTGRCRDWGAGGVAARLQVGYQSGVLEFSGMTVQNLGLDPLVSDAAEAVKPANVAARIETYRKGDLTVAVVDERGNPIPQAKVSVVQKSHGFLFGCNIFNLDPDDGSPWQQEYQRRFTDLFNYATLPFYWGTFEAVQGQPDDARLENMAAWCRDHGLTAKGHPLVWHTLWPAWAPKEAEPAKALLQARIRQIIPRYADRISLWDVQNEANASAAYPQTGLGKWVARSGAAQVVQTTLDWARQAATGLGQSLLYNDYETGPPNLDLLRTLQSRNALPDAVGIQSHMHTGLWDLAETWRTVQRFGAFGKPLHFTETTVLSAPTRVIDFANPPAYWTSTPEDERVQAEYVARYYSLLFSHPQVAAISWWDLSDFHAWMDAPAGLVRMDLTPKPAYGRLFDLIRKQWWSVVEGRSDPDGLYKARVFFGRYSITVTAPGGRTAERLVDFPAGQSLLVVPFGLK